MDSIGEKLTSLTGDAVSSISKAKSGTRSGKTGQSRNEEQQATQTYRKNVKLSSDIDVARPINSSGRSGPSYGQDGFLFGGESISLSRSGRGPPEIGFRKDYLIDRSSNVAGDDRQQSESSKKPGELTASDSNESIYDGDAWSRAWFQRVMVLTLIRLILFIRKVYEDFQATEHYMSGSSHFGHLLIAASTLILPTLVFTIYRVTRYLQFALPAYRSIQASHQTTLQPDETLNTQTSRENTRKSQNLQNLSDDPQAGKALMDSTHRNQTSSSRLGNNEDDGLVTARQSPTNPEEYLDSKSQPDLVSMKLMSPQAASVSPTPSSLTAMNNPDNTSRVTICVENLGNFSDKHTVQLIIGASEQLLHGVLYIFWQLKRQVDVVGYLVERVCLWRPPKAIEKEELDRLRTGSDGLEWFQDFYAAFLAILAQIYVLGLEAVSHSPSKYSSVNEKLISNLSTSSPSSTAGPGGSAATLLENFHQLTGSKPVNTEDLKLTSEIIVSTAVVFSLLIAVRRRDDGPLTFALSILGWGSIFTSRIIIIAFSFVHVGWKIMLPLVIGHVLGMTAWIYKIAIDSHNGVQDESEEDIWDQEAAESPSSAQRNTKNREEKDATPSVTDAWTQTEHIVLLVQILTLFAVPSLFYWPIMFNLKLHCRPFKYLVLVLIENFLLIPAVYFALPSSSPSTSQLYFLGGVGAFSIIGFVFVSLYVSCKPNLTEYFARADELFNEAEKSGIYYEFCSRVFKLPDLSKHAFRRLMNQSVREEEIESP